MARPANSRVRLLAVTLLAGLAACPSRLDRENVAENAGPTTKEDDPRVVRDSGDLYVDEAGPAPSQGPVGDPDASRGTGRPDETNGVCRLYAPKLKNPSCCQEEYGFDAERTRKRCGHDLYLGEHFRATCGYYFMSQDQPYTWFRASFIPDATSPKDAADAHDRVFQHRGRRPDFHSEPIPGLPGAYWSRDAHLRWAFLPGWSKVRRITWRAESCPDDQIVGLLTEIRDAREPPEGKHERTGLLPVARP